MKPRLDVHLFRRIGAYRFPWTALYYVGAVIDCNRKHRLAGAGIPILQ